MAMIIGTVISVVAFFAIPTAILAATFAATLVAIRSRSSLMTRVRGTRSQ